MLELRLLKGFPLKTDGRIVTLAEFDVSQCLYCRHVSDRSVAVRRIV